MSRNPELEALLQAKYELDGSAEEQRDAFLRRYHALLDRAIVRSALPGLTRHEVEESLAGPYREFRRARLMEERAKLSRLR